MRRITLLLGLLLASCKPAKPPDLVGDACAAGRSVALDSAYTLRRDGELGSVELRLSPDGKATLGRSSHSRGSSQKEAGQACAGSLPAERACRFAAAARSPVVAGAFAGGSHTVGLDPRRRDGSATTVCRGDVCVLIGEGEVPAELLAFRDEAQRLLSTAATGLQCAGDAP